jgi:hypothetical protein
VAQNLKLLDRWVLIGEWPHVECPLCDDGYLSPSTDGLITVDSGPSRIYRDHDGWEPDWLTGRFHGVLECRSAECQETVVVAGDYKVDYVNGPDGHWYGEWGEYLQLRYARPALPLLRPPDKIPDDVKAAIESASEVLWSDPGAAANRLRVGIEHLLTAHKVAKTTVSKKGKRERISTHARIQLFKTAKPVVGDALEAVKWIGNAGSHDSELVVSDVLDGAEMLGYALRLLYDKSDAEIQRRIREVNRRRGPAKPAPRKTTGT